jgi:hypothetical protein
VPHARALEEAQVLDLRRAEDPQAMQLRLQYISLNRTLKSVQNHKQLALKSLNLSLKPLKPPKPLTLTQVRYESHAKIAKIPKSSHEFATDSLYPAHHVERLHLPVVSLLLRLLLGAAALLRHLDPLN